MGQRDARLKIRELAVIYKNQKEEDCIELPQELVEKSVGVIEAFTQKFPIVVIETPFELLG